ncbi:hypothetical protein A4G28_27145 [Mycobacterium ostraviense]|uniref:Transposase n=1 Tax=Mycobacterium ostraviense TaxID=2738409 RepID=A0A164DUI4_9MYCO|nr:hypothetical protein A4G28_27145 [Mycobacterium ostraviense]
MAVLREQIGAQESPRPQLMTCHLSPGTSKWNKIEHRLFSHISMNWRGRPLVPPTADGRDACQRWTRKYLAIA